MIYNGSSYNENWKISKLAELGTFARGVSKHRPRNDPKLFENGKYPLVQTGDVKEATLYLSKHEQEYGDFGLKQSKLWNTGTLCITIAANIAETAILAYPMCFPDSIVGFSAYPEKSSEEFMYYIFEYIKKSIQNAATGSIQDNINLEYLMSLDFKIPEKKYQDMIVLILSSIDRKILINNAINDNLEQQAKLLYNYWFIQFNFPDENGNPYYSSGGQLVWNKNLQQEIPQDWRSGNLYDIADYINGIACQKYRPSDEEHSLPVVKIREMNGGITNDTERVSSTIPAKNVISSGDILFSWSASLEVIMWYGGDAGLNQHIFKVVPKSYFSSEYVYLQLSEYLIHFIKIAEARKTTMGHITSEHLQDSHIILPPANIIKKFSEYVRPIYQMKKQIANETSELIKLRDWLLPMLMNGQATISD